MRSASSVTAEKLVRRAFTGVAIVVLGAFSACKRPEDSAAYGEQGLRRASASQLPAEGAFIGRGFAPLNVIAKIVVSTILPISMTTPKRTMAKFHDGTSSTLAFAVLFSAAKSDESLRVIAFTDGRDDRVRMQSRRLTILSRLRSTSTVRSSQLHTFHAIDRHDHVASAQPVAGIDDQRLDRPVLLVVEESSTCPAGPSIALM